MCEYENCPKAEEEYKDSYCIFHCDKENFKDEEIKVFDQEFQKYFEEQKNDKEVKVLNFVGFKFPVEFSFKERKFEKTVNFAEAVFSGCATFKKATFSDAANFGRVIFSSGADFRYVTFSDYANFGDATFSGNVYFVDATFSETADFRGAKFTSDADFEMATFTSDAYFLWVIFNSEANFRWTTFSGRGIFGEVKFHNSVRFIGDDKNKVFLSSADFYSSFFEHSKRVEFVKVDLSNALFLHCRGIENFRFIDEKWNKKDGRKATHDEIIAKEDDYELVAEIYRKLRLNYEHNLRFSEAGDFYIGEMEMRRKNVKLFGREIKNRILNLISRNISLIAWYRNFSYYGENYFLPVVWMFAVTLGFAFYYYSPADFFTGFDIHGINASNFLESWKTSIMILFQMPPEQMTFSIFIERILGVLFVALFVLALRRKFKKGGE